LDFFFEEIKPIQSKFEKKRKKENKERKQINSKQQSTGLHVLSVAGGVKHCF
jgi:hypothetical protein